MHKVDMHGTASKRAGGQAGSQQVGRGSSSRQQKTATWIMQQIWSIPYIQQHSIIPFICIIDRNIAI